MLNIWWYPLEAHIQPFCPGGRFFSALRIRRIFFPCFLPNTKKTFYWYKSASPSCLVYMYQYLSPMFLLGASSFICLVGVEILNKITLPQTSLKKANRNSAINPWMKVERSANLLLLLLIRSVISSSFVTLWTVACQASLYTGVCCHFLFQGIFPTQGSKLHLLHRQVDSLPLSHFKRPKWALKGTKYKKRNI